MEIILLSLLSSIFLNDNIYLYLILLLIMTFSDIVDSFVIFSIDFKFCKRTLIS